MTIKIIKKEMKKNNKKKSNGRIILATEFNKLESSEGILKTLRTCLEN